ncbi:MFS transporter [Gordonia humi]|uniref:Putative MFS family arabinose efflux permease n=1 Tax=Gordonia humi TaxID=686429 RepID=A0A840F0G7_9ACTN|nr:MFS transporter [Gordonia humi]MBB4137371.1 putative MFS family arabinose efflux permease [Gordonia humi]
MTHTSPSGNGRPGVLLAAILLGVVVVPTGVSGTGVALPHIAADLGSQPAQLQWVVNGFNLTFAVFSLVAGSIADHLGRRRGLLLGGVVFAAAGVLSALSPDLVVLDLARALAGVGAAIIFACSGALIAITFSGKAAARAFALFGTAAGVGLGLGPSISSAAIALIGWTGIFWFNAVAIIIAIALVLLSGVHDTPAQDTGQIDYRGALVFAAALSLVIAGVAQSSSWGWSSPGTIVLVAGGILLLAVFVRLQAVTGNPLLDLSLLRSPRLVGLLLVPVAGAVGFVTLLTYYPTFLTGVWQLGSGSVGAVMLIMTVPVIVGPIVAGALHGRGVPTWVILGASVAFYVIGAALLTRENTAVDVPDLILPFVLLGAGFGLGVGLVDGQAIGSVPEEKSGMVSGLVSTVRLGSEAVVVAVFASALSVGVGGKVRQVLPDTLDAGDQDTIVDRVVTGEIHDASGVAADALREAFATGLVPLLWTIVGVSAVLAVSIVVLLRRTAEPTTTTAGSEHATPAAAERDPLGVAEATREHAIDSRIISERTPR